MKLKRKVAVGLFTNLLVLGSWLGLLGKIYYYSSIDESQEAEAIVVLGASQWNGRPSPVLQGRLDHAYNLFEKGLASKIILTGGVGEGEKISESQVGKAYLIAKGLQADQIFIEDAGRTTWQSLKEVRLIGEKETLDSFILVSDGYHMMRLKKMANDLEMVIYCSPVFDNEGFEFGETKFLLRESLVYTLYLIFKI